MAYGDNYGDGKLYPLEDKPLNKCRRWQMKVSVNGKPHKRNFNGTQGEARKALKAFKDEVEGSVADQKSGTFAEYADTWLARRDTLGQVAKSTLRKDTSRTRRLVARFGDLPIYDITRADVEAYYMDLMLDGRRPNYVRETHTALSNIMSDAVDDGVIQKSPSKGARLPKKEKSTKRAMPAGQLSSFVAALDPTDQFEIVYFLCAAVGLRRGEAMGLSWQDVDLESRVIHVRHSMKEDNEIGDTKTDGSERDIPMPGFVHDAMESRLKAQHDELKSAGIDAEPTFITESAGEPLPYRATAYDWTCRRDRLGAGGYTIHELRHSFASMMANDENCPVKVLMAILGHTDINTTLAIYVHSSKELETRAMLGIEGRFRDVCVPGNVLEQTGT